METPKEQEAIQTLINFPTSGTPSQQPLKISTPRSSTTKIARVLHYGDPELDEEIVIPGYDSKTIAIDQINEV